MAWLMAGCVMNSAHSRAAGFFLHRPPQKPSVKIAVNFSESDGFH